MHNVNKKINNKLYVLGGKYKSSYYEREYVLSSQANMTSVCRDDTNNKRNNYTVTLFELIPVKTMTPEEYLKEVKDKTLWNVE